MLCHDKRLVYPNLFNDSKGYDGEPEALNKFKGVLIVAYEQALDDGLSSDAIFSAMLDLVSAELKRCVHFNG